MIAPLIAVSLEDQTEFVHDKFLALMPLIRQQAVFAFRGLRAEASDELTEEVVANSYCAFVKLVRRGKSALAYPTPLAQFAIRQIRAGRRVGGRMNVNDVLTGYAFRRKGSRPEQFGTEALHTGLHEALVLDYRTPVDEQAAFRIDFTAWLARLAPRQKRIAKFLAAGNSTNDAASSFRVSPARISQLRAWFRIDWERFHGGTQMTERVP